MDELAMIYRRALYEIKTQLATKPKELQYASQYWHFLMALRNDPEPTDLTPDVTAGLRDFVDDMVQLPHICRDGLERKKNK